jgi:uncharacterized protein YggU (UPF0235/DUF167 family)
LNLRFCSDAPGGVVLSVRVIPRAKKTEIGGARGDALLVRLAGISAVQVMRAVGGEGA